MLTSIKEQMQNLNFTLTPSTVLIDFEIALRQSVQLQFPAVSIKGCYFHFTQCIYRWIQTHGLAIDYRENASNIRTFVNCAALAFLPPANIRLAFASVSGAQDHTVPSVQQFATYFQQTWLRDFPIVRWNHWETTSERTNNRLEGWHNRINRLAGRPHPNIYQLIDLIKKEDGASIVTLQQIQTGGLIVSKKKIWERNDNVADILKTVSAVDLSASVTSFLQLVNCLDFKH